MVAVVAVVVLGLNALCPCCTLLLRAAGCGLRAAGWNLHGHARVPVLLYTPTRPIQCNVPPKSKLSPRQVL
jgi:hypothetical protein